MLVHALGLLCALGAVTLAVATSPRWPAMTCLAGGFVLAAFWMPVSPGWIGGISAVVAALRLSNVWRGDGWLVAAIAGMLAGVWASVLHLKVASVVALRSAPRHL